MLFLPYVFTFTTLEMANDDISSKEHFEKEKPGEVLIYL
jgi:hypothetical protein